MIPLLLRVCDRSSTLNVWVLMLIERGVMQLDWCMRVPTPAPADVKRLWVEAALAVCALLMPPTVLLLQI